MTCEDTHRVVVVPVIVKPVVVPVPGTVVIAIEVENVAVAVRVAEICIVCHLRHCPLSTLRAVSYSA